MKTLKQLGAKEGDLIGWSQGIYSGTFTVTREHLDDYTGLKESKYRIPDYHEKNPNSFN